jgi:hypothetical protein
MEKQIGLQNSNSSTVVSEFKSPGKHKKIPRKRISQYFLTLIIVALVIYVPIHIINAHQKSEQKINTALLKRLNDSNDCSTQALNSIAKEKPNPKQVNASIALLSYRATCYAIHSQTEQALAQNQLLLSYYQKANNTDMVSVVNSVITVERQIINNPPKNESNSTFGKADAQYAQQLKEEDK